MKKTAINAIDDALYGMMKVFDGVSDGLENLEYCINLRLHARLTKNEDVLVSDLDMFDGDGLCMGYAGWLEGDFGNAPVAIKKVDTK